MSVHNWLLSFDLVEHTSCFNFHLLVLFLLEMSNLGCLPAISMLGPLSEPIIPCTNRKSDFGCLIATAVIKKTTRKRSIHLFAYLMLDIQFLFDC